MKTLACAFVISLLALACTAKIDTVPSDKSDPITSDAGTPKAPTSKPSDPATPSTSKAPVPAPSCGTKADQASCIACCDTQTATEFKTQIALAVYNCTCATEAPCAEACEASFCGFGDAPPDAACKTCLDNAGEEKRCAAAARVDCKENEVCAPALACVTSSGCEKKP